jgi:hypothetical protein
VSSTTLPPNVTGDDDAFTQTQYFKHSVMIHSGHHFIANVWHGDHEFEKKITQPIFCQI